MSKYRAPETLTSAEQARLLRVSARCPRPRDHILFSIALGTGLQLSELPGLTSEMRRWPGGCVS